VCRLDGLPSAGLVSAAAAPLVLAGD
jgi:hypothetical protein